VTRRLSDIQMAKLSHVIGVDRDVVLMLINSLSSVEIGSSRSVKEVYANTSDLSSAAEVDILEPFPTDTL